ncbi:MAG: nucleotidyl transferase AbiEii/AbiGii toxin family protein [Chitinophagaceae bacterium]
MLQTQTIEPGTLSTLKKLMALPELSDFLLVGGTALSLHYGHRLSIDIDLFATSAFNNEDIIQLLEKEFKDFTYHSKNDAVGIFGYIDNVKVDLVKHSHPLIDSPFINEGIRLISIPDIIAMKINAIMKRGVKKDFWDIAELLQHYTMVDFIKYYEKKYPSQQLLISIPQALTYFEDAEESEDPISLKGQKWVEIKKSIQKKVSAFLK